MGFCINCLHSSPRRCLIAIVLHVGIIGGKMRDLQGRLLGGRYLLHRHLRRELSGDIYRAVDRRMEREVVVKVGEISTGRDLSAEYGILVSLRHPWVVAADDYGVDSRLGVSY